MSTRDLLPAQRASDVLTRCPRCGSAWPTETIVCPSCGADLGGATVLESVERAFGDDTDLQGAMERRSHSEPDRHAGVKSSDPPTAFLRRPESHIEMPPGSLVDDAYEIDHRLGAGAMGEVYAARHLKLGKRVAIKVISPRLSEDAAAVERFTQEARTLAQMRHPGLVDVLGFGDLADGRAYFVMEFLSGESLFDRLARGRVERDAALDIFGQLARALEAAHAHGVVHRDLKPENIFLARVTNEQRPIVKLLDFGLAKLSLEVDRRVERTQSGVVIGTATHLSPEQARGPDVDGRSDVYALGCVGYELLLGRHPFEEARTVAALIAAHLHDVPPLPRSIDSKIPPELDLLLFAMLAKDPAHRPTLRQIRSVIEGVRAPAIAASHPAPPVRPATASAVTGWIRRGTIAVVVVLLVLVVVFGAALHGSRSAADSPAATASEHTVDAASSVLPDAAVAAVAVIPSAPIDAGLSLAVESTRSAQPPTRGYLRILSPQGARILVDGSVADGPLSRLPLTSGKHRVQFSLGSSRDSFSVVIKEGQIVTLDKRDLYRAAPVVDRDRRTVNPFEKESTPR